jgi:hypothetical protein
MCRLDLTQAGDRQIELPIRMTMLRTNLLLGLLLLALAKSGS